MTNGATRMVQFEKTRLNVWNVGAIMLALVVNSFGLGVVYTQLNARIAEGDRDRTQRSQSTDANFAAINRQLAPFDTALFRLVQVETQATEINKRLDRIVESVGTKLDTVGENVNLLRTEVRVISEKVDTLSENNPKRTQFTPLTPDLFRQ